MGKKKFYIIILGLIILLTGCGKEEKENLGDNYILGKDNQYYFFSGQYLYSKDKSTGEVTVLCDKPDAFIIKKRLVRFLWTGIYVKEDVKRIIA